MRWQGAAPPEKHATLLERMQGQVSTSRMFYTISAQTRSAPSFSRGNTILPPFTMPAFARALSSLDVSARFVARGEADGMCVVVADQLGGYVLGKDTDFIILSSAASGNMKGYVPLDMVEWIEGERSEGRADGGSFMTVTAKKQQARMSRLLPPKNYRNPTLVLYTYNAPSLCRRLRLPANMLPLLSSLVGNDYTPTSAADLFFSGGAKPAERIEKVARILREQLARPLAHSDVTDLVRRVVRKLCTRPYVDDHEVDELVDAVIEATIQYVLPQTGECCSIYPFCGEGGCQTNLSRLSTPLATPPSPPEGVAAYAAAQRRGLLHNITHAFLYPDRLYLWSVLEDPSGPCSRASSSATIARQAAYSIADEALGGLSFPEPTIDELEVLQQDKDVCKLLGVASGDKGDAEENDSQEQRPSTPDEADLAAAFEPPQPSHSVTEYLRQGSSSRIASRTLDLPTPLTNDPPTCLRPVTDRLKTYLLHLGSDIPEIHALPLRLQPLAAATRMCIVEAAENDTTGSRRWRKDELEAVLRAGIGCLEGWDLIANADDEETTEDGELEESYPLLTNRNAEIVAQLSSALADASFLAQSLLLTPDSDTDNKDNLTHLTPYALFSGSALHFLLSGQDPPVSTGWRWSAAYRNKYRDTLAAVLADLPADVLGFARAHGPKSPKAESPQQRRKGSKKANGHSANGSASSGGRFDLLMSEKL